MWGRRIVKRSWGVLVSKRAYLRMEKPLVMSSEAQTTNVRCRGLGKIFE